MIFNEQYIKPGEPLPEPIAMGDIKIHRVIKRFYKIDAVIVTLDDKELLLRGLSKIDDLFNELDETYININEIMYNALLLHKYKDNHKNKYKIACVNDEAYTIKATLRTMCGLTALKKAIGQHVNV